jgi:uncharacterized protein YndB with AHSA1/START domain
MPAPKTESAGDFVITRTFNAPRALVWKAWTDRDALMQWFGPKGVKIVKAELDLRAGGVFHYAMQQPNGAIIWGKWTFLEIKPPEKLVVITSFSDEHGGVTRHPLAPNWPAETLSTTTFSEAGGSTTIALRWSAYNASEEEAKLFAAARDGMNQGWGGTMEQLEDYLASAQQR